MYIYVCQGTLDSASFAVAPHEQAAISYGRVLPLRPCSLGSDAATWYALMPLAWYALMPLAVALGRQAFCGGATAERRARRLLGQKKPMLDSRIQSSRRQIRA